MATAHLVHGYLGAGKTSFAARLEPVVRGIRLSADEWYLRLYAGDAPTGHQEQASWDRLSTLLNELWPGLLAHGVDVILDFGFWTRHSRDEARALARAAGAEAKLYVVVCADDVAKARCLPPAPFKPHDAWRFNRELSYLRRPLLVWSEGLTALSMLCGVTATFDKLWTT